MPAKPEFFGDAAYAGAWPAALERLGALGHPGAVVEQRGDFVQRREVDRHDAVAERHAAVRTLLARQPEAFDDTVKRVISRALDMSATDAFVAQHREEYERLRRQHARPRHKLLSLEAARERRALYRAASSPRRRRSATDPLKRLLDGLPLADLGPLYGKTIAGVKVCAPAALAQELL